MNIKWKGDKKDNPEIAGNDVTKVKTQKERDKENQSKANYQKDIDRNNEVIADNTREEWEKDFAREQNAALIERIARSNKRIQNLNTFIDTLP